MNPNNAVAIFDNALEFLKFNFEEESTIFLCEDGAEGEYSVYADIGNATICLVTRDITDFLVKLDAKVSSNQEHKRSRKGKKRV
jgi:hypothetical protein